MTAIYVGVTLLAVGVPAAVLSGWHISGRIERALAARERRDLETWQRHRRAMERLR